MKEEPTIITRRDFLKSTAAAAGGAVLSAVTHADVLAAAASAEVVLYNGKIATMDTKNTIVQALAISGGKVLKTGTDQVVKALAGPKTQMIDLKARTVTPGFVDAHNHMSPFGMVGTAYLDINPPAVTTMDQLQKVIKDGCARTPAGKWVIAQGYIGFDGETPDKTTLDPVSPNHPVMLINQGGHMGTVNSAALKLANVTAATKDPPYGMLIRDSSGNPTGELVNHSAMDIFRKLWAAEVVTTEVRRQSILKPQPDYASYGITTVGDVNVRGMDYVKSYFDIAKKHENTVRTYILNTIEYFPELAGRPEEVKAVLYEDDGMHFGGYKFLVDGAMAAAYMHEPTKGIVWNLATWKPDDLKQAASTVHDLGYQCSFHCIGDAAMDMALDAIEYAMNRNPRPDPRHRIEHAVLSTQSALERTRDLGVTISTQPHGIYYLGKWFRENWGEERANRVVPTRTYLEMGVPLSVSSDCPTMLWWQPNLILGSAVTRLDGITKKVLNPDECLTLEEALRAYTMGGAYACREEKIKGSLEVGKFGDLVVWKIDPFTGNPTELLKGNPVAMTIIGGKVVYQAK